VKGQGRPYFGPFCLTAPGEYNLKINLCNFISSDFENLGYAILIFINLTGMSVGIIFSKGTKSGVLSFFPLETKKTTIFC